MGEGRGAEGGRLKREGEGSLKGEEEEGPKEGGGWGVQGGRGGVQRGRRRGFKEGRGVRSRREGDSRREGGPPLQGGRGEVQVGIIIYYSG